MTTDLSDIKDQDLVHLHCHTEYSLLDGAIRIKELVQRAKSLGHQAVAMTDHGNLFGAIEFYAAAKDAGIKPIIGSEIFHQGGDETKAFAAAKGLEGPNAGAYHLVLLAKDEPGYKNLIKIVSKGYLEGLGEVPVVPERAFDEHRGGMIALSSCLRGEFGVLVRALRDEAGEAPLTFDAQEGVAGLAQQALDAHVARMKERFGPDGYYVELIDNGLPEQKALMPDLVAAARHYGLPLVATADAHYATKDKAEAHAVLLGIKHGLTMSKIRGRRKGTRFHLFDNTEMRQLYGAWPEALANQKVIADTCNLSFKFGEYYLPNYDTGEEPTADALRRIARQMLEERFVQLEKLYGPSFDDKKKQEYRERLEYELDVIIKMGFPGYFLIVQDFINWAKAHGIPVGPGRGSGAGSLVAYALRITDLDPIPYNLLFERFLNPERVSMPDFDVDFCQDRRDEVIRYVTEKYGATNVAQITTFGKMNAKAVVRDVGRVLELGYGRVDRIAKLIPDDLGITLEEAIEKEPRLTEEAEKDETVADLLRLARELEGLARHTSVHAAGIVISAGPMTDYVPVYTTEEDGLITQFDMKRVEKVGLVKFDFLGLKTLTVIKKAVDFIRERRDPNFDINLIPLDDRKVYEEISSGNTMGIFQLESSGMRNLIVKLKPSVFEDIIALVALFRPGPLGSGMVDSFIERKHGREKIEYPHPWLEDILKETYGTILYQEQVMKIAQVMANYTLGEADLLRRAMGKKIASEMEKQKSRFVAGAIENKIDEAKASEIFDLMAEFANYGFNKSHSAAYGLVSYQTAYLKTHYPEEFMAALMTYDMDNTSKIVRYVEDCKRMKLKVLPPDLNTSSLTFDVPGDGKVGFALLAVKGIGAQALEPLLEERAQGGPFKSPADLARRVNLQKVGKKTLELLCQVGALDCFGMNRASLFERLGELVKFSEELHQAKGQGQGGLFDDLESEDDQDVELAWDLAPEDLRPGPPDANWLQFEKKFTGVYLRGHPLDFHKADCDLFGRARLSELEKHVGKQVSVVAVLAAMNEKITKSGSRMASLRLEDQHAAFEAVMFQREFPEEWPPAQSLVVATGSVDKSFDGTSIRFRLDRLELVEEKRQEHVKSIAVRLKAPESAKPGEIKEMVARLKKVLDENPGDTPIKLVIDYGQAEVLVDLASRQVAPTDAFLRGVDNLPFSGISIAFQAFGGDRREAREASASMG